MKIRSSGVLYVAIVQLVFSSLDIYARMSLKNGSTFFDAVGRPWFIYWLCLQALIAPFQIRLITQQGLGRGVALMNAFSVLYACAGGYLIAHEALRVQDVIAACLVVFATYLFVVRKPVVIVSQQDEKLADPGEEGGSGDMQKRTSKVAVAGDEPVAVEGGPMTTEGKGRTSSGSSKRRRGRKRSRKQVPQPVFDAEAVTADAAQ